ncbi:MAG: ABC transporter ATP-binding protein [Paraburkholderia nemoris]|uniref:ABC transporter ATP-binding protein n=1 Tax=Paraburkholderia nemoris TaxID=2793076 RepID=UPI00190CBD00|nr:ABC transporter ATP-binding protein [Paraburkholderia nemoris]MBK3737939.1 ABC transporter ATP-binding protein [Paraburkholderia aspalathi]CAE6737524.1 Nitrate import ATP-binding protein NrtD [Paraburkholderia nemoris]
MVAVPEVLNQLAAARPVRDGARIDVRHVSHQLALRGAALPVLQDVSFTVEPGEFVALLGPSGCGKSTLLRLVAGLDTPTQGSVQADGAAIAGPDPSRVVVFQDPTLYPWRTVRGNVGVGPQAQRKRFARRNGPQEEQAQQRIDAALELVGLSEFAEAFPHQLSGGMAQRVALARALVNDPALLVLDEPFGKLDSLTRIRMQGELARLWKDARFSVLLVTHDVEEALLLADRVIVFSERPARVVAEVRNDAPYPRHRDDPKLVALRREVLAQLGLDT